MTPYQQAIQQINQKYQGTTTTSAPAKPNILQKAGNFLGEVGKTIASPFARLGVEAFNTTKGTLELASNPNTWKNLSQGKFRAPIAGSGQAASEFDQSRNLPLLGPTKPTLTNSSRPGLNQALDVAGQGIQLGADALGGEGFGSGVVNGLKTGGTIGASQGFGNALTQTEGKSFGQNVSNIAEQTAVGGATGAVIGGAVNGVHQIFSRPTPLVNPDLVTATAERGAAAEQGVNALNQMGQQVGKFKSDLGTNFAQGAKQLETLNPNVKLTLSNKTLDSLNNLREGKNFALPEGLDQETNPLLGTNMGKDFLAKNAGKLSEIQNAGKVELTHTQTQDLIRRLNKLTFDAKASGDLAVNQQTIGLTNEIKQSASKTFGPEWDKVYSNYSQGINAVEKLNDIVNLDKNATPTDLNKSLNQVLKLGQTPEGKIILRQAIEEFKNTSGVDLSNPVQAMHQILDKQIALEQAQATAEKGNFIQQFAKGATDPKYLGKRLVEGAVISIVAYGWLRKLAKSAGIIP